MSVRSRAADYAAMAGRSGASDHAGCQPMSAAVLSEGTKPDAIVRSDRYAGDRGLQLSLLEALDASPRALRRDECGDWRITGKHGHIYTWGDGSSFWVYFGCRSIRHWNFTKRRLAGLVEITQDGDEEGAGRLLGSPTEEQAAILRDILGIPKRRSVSPEEIERLRQFAFRARPAEGVQAAQAAQAGQNDLRDSPRPETIVRA